ncbi:lysozyme inhibitor LprI family protein [Snodgrassella sp. CFCC 13594]|uniref:lysozyme inhibitor LprI family protein n=1 Tax=Snodgrassella sp. CFCC 13594 TaxID=1775559 RepID=UPI0018D453D9|nr:lysozyme inhibitor LprI family protein [Snodgrassella sp. CFCC 13594]
MMKPFIIGGSLAIAMVLAACSDKKPEAPQLTCDNPALVQTLQQQIQQTIGNNARQFAQTDARQFVDGDKVIAAASQLGVSIQNAQLDSNTANPACSAQLNVAIPTSVWQTTQANAPLLLGKRDWLATITQQLNGSGITLAGNTFSQTIHYAPIPMAASAALSASAPSAGLQGMGIETLSGILANALLPYGIKDMVVINGQVYNRTDAIAMTLNPQSAPLSPDAQMASAILNGAAAEAVAPPTQADFSGTDLQDARDNNRNATGQLNQAWHSLDDTIRQELQNDQRKWVGKKTTQCQKEAAKAETTLQAEYLRLKCDTRLTNQRIDYLKGYSIH